MDGLVSSCCGIGCIGQSHLSGFLLLQFAEFDLLYSTDVSSLAFVSILGVSVAFFRLMYVADVSISPLVTPPGNSKSFGPLMIWWMSIH